MPMLPMRPVPPTTSPFISLSARLVFYRTITCLQCELAFIVMTAHVSSLSAFSLPVQFVFLIVCD